MPESTDTNEDRNSIPTAGSAHSGESAPPSKTDSSDFQTGYVATFTFAHAIHDTYSAFMAPLLPTLMANFSHSMTQAGVLDFASTILAIIQPLVGHVGDRLNLRYLIILAPAITGTMMSLLGVAPNYAALILLTLAAGLGSAFLHALAPAVSARFSGAKLGWGMGVWMAGGSIGFAIGPVMVAVLPGSVLGRDEGERGLKGLEAEVPVGGHAEASTAQHKRIAGPACQTHRGLRNSKGRRAVAEPCPIAAWDGCRVTDGGSGV